MTSSTTSDSTWSSRPITTVLGTRLQLLSSRGFCSTSTPDDVDSSLSPTAAAVGAVSFTEGTAVGATEGAGAGVTQTEEAIMVMAKGAKNYTRTTSTTTPSGAFYASQDLAPTTTLPSSVKRFWVTFGGSAGRAWLIVGIALALVSCIGGAIFVTRILGGKESMMHLNEAKSRARQGEMATTATRPAGIQEVPRSSTDLLNNPPEAATSATSSPDHFTPGSYSILPPSRSSPSRCSLPVEIEKLLVSGLQEIAERRRKRRATTILSGGIENVSSSSSSSSRPSPPRIGIEVPILQYGATHDQHVERDDHDQHLQEESQDIMPRRRSTSRSRRTSSTTVLHLPQPASTSTLFLSAKSSLGDEKDFINGSFFSVLRRLSNSSTAVPLSPISSPDDTMVEDRTYEDELLTPMNETSGGNFRAFMGREDHKNNGSRTSLNISTSEEELVEQEGVTSGALTEDAVESEARGPSLSSRYTTGDEEATIYDGAGPGLPATNRDSSLSQSSHRTPALSPVDTTRTGGDFPAAVPSVLDTTGTSTTEASQNWWVQSLMSLAARGLFLQMDIEETLNDPVCQAEFAQFCRENILYPGLKYDILDCLRKSKMQRMGPL
ncbi:unnamed protein product [Amoebophrya sp. A25]|nr:unnamed protein product [Amoebophrya sp. A25]|eukprot:GSA25T00005531001.1